MNYRETVRSIRSFMGWNRIPTFESNRSEPDKCNNPWKGKTPKCPARISVTMPPDDWLHVPYPRNISADGKNVPCPSYIVNHAIGVPGFNRCTSELQERTMNNHVTMLCSHMNKGKAPKEVSAALTT